MVLQASGQKEQDTHGKCSSLLSQDPTQSPRNVFLLPPSLSHSPSLPDTSLLGSCKVEWQVLLPYLLIQRSKAPTSAQDFSGCCIQTANCAPQVNTCSHQEDKSYSREGTGPEYRCVPLMTLKSFRRKQLRVILLIKFCIRPTSAFCEETMFSRNTSCIWVSIHIWKYQGIRHTYE